MEPYRPFVDRAVLKMVLEADTTDNLTELNTDLKKKLLGIPYEDAMIDGMKSPLMVAAQRTTASLARCFEGEQRKILYPSFPRSDDPEDE
jgi:CRISPR-associated protein Cas1